MAEQSGEPEDLVRSAGDAVFRTLVEQLPAIVYIVTNERASSTLYISPQAEKILGRRAQEFADDPDLWRRSISGEDRDRVMQEWAEAFDRRHPFESEYRWSKPDGSVIWLRDGCVLFRDKRGVPQFWQGVVRDITKSKLAEESRRESEARYRFLVENIPAVVYLVAPDDDRRTLYVSSHVEQALGYTQSEWLDQPDIWMELLHPDDREQTLAAHDRHNASGKPWSREYRLIASDGRAVWFRDVATLVEYGPGHAPHWLGVQTDITEQKRVEEELRTARDELEWRVQDRMAELEEANQLMALEIGERRRAEEELRQTEDRYRMLVEHIPAVTYIWQADHGPDVEPRYYTSPRIEQLLGYTVDEWHRSTDFWMSRLHPDDRTAVIANTLRSESTGERFSMEYRYLHKDGRIVWVLDEAVLMSRDGRGRPDLFQGVMIDLTDRKEAEAKARESELRYRSVTEHVPAIIYVWDLDPGDGPDLTYVSPQLQAMLGYSREEWDTIERWLETVHPDDRHRVSGEVADIVRTGRPFAMEYRVLRRDGGVRWVRDQGIVLTRDDIGRARELHGIVIDVTGAGQREQEHSSAQVRPSS